MSMRILLADPNQLFRNGVRAILEGEGMDVVGEASNGREAARMARALRPDAVILNACMPVLNGIDAGKQIRHDLPDTKTVLLVTHCRPESIRDALEAGISACVSQTVGASALVKVVREAAEGAIYLDASIASTIQQGDGADADTLEPLSLREREVLQLIAEGEQVKEAAALLGISSKTVESHRQHIMSKLKMRETADLVRYAVRHGIVDA